MQQTTSVERTESKLLRNDLNLKDLVLNARVAMALLEGEQFRVEVINEAALTMAGKPLQEVEGIPLFDAFPELKITGLDYIFKEVYITGKAQTVKEIPFESERQGTFITSYYDMDVQPVKDENGKVVGLLGMMCDNCRVAQLSRVVFETESIYRNLVYRINQGFCIIKVLFDENNKPVDYIFKEVNPAFEAATGLKDVINKRMRELAPHHDEHWFERYGRVALTGEEDFFSAAAKALGRWYDVFAFRVGHPSQRLVAVLFADVSERKSIEDAQKLFTEELQKLVQHRTHELQRSNEDLLQFAHVASHDMREPLRKIMMYSNMLLDHSNEKDKDFSSLTKIRSAAERLISILESILRYSTVESLTEGEKTDVDLNKVMAEILDDIEVLTGEKRASIEICELPVVRGLPVRIYQLFYNLITNALKFARPDVPLRIRVKSETIEVDGKPFASITVTDNGIGFEQQYAESIFNKFTRLNPKDQYEGTGLGLALGKKIAELHSGTIQANGKPGKGSTFTVTLPLTEQT